MKNLIYAVAVVAILGIASCSNNGKTVELSEADTVEVVTDTLSDGAVDTLAVDTIVVVEDSVL